MNYLGVSAVAASIVNSPPPASTPPSPTGISSSPPSPSSSNPSQDDSLPVLAIAVGAGVGGAALLAMIAASCAYVVWRYRSKKETKEVYWYPPPPAVFSPATSPVSSPPPRGAVAEGQQWWHPGQEVGSPVSDGRPSTASHYTVHTFVLSPTLASPIQKRFLSFEP